MHYPIEMPIYIYIIDNIDWNKEEKYKYGFTKNPVNRILNSSEQHSYNSTYTKLYKVEKTTDYKVDYTEYDKSLLKGRCFEDTLCILIHYPLSRQVIYQIYPSSY